MSEEDGKSTVEDPSNKKHKKAKDKKSNNNYDRLSSTNSDYNSANQEEYTEQKDVTPATLFSTVEAAATPEPERGVETRARKDKPSARVRFTESAQPGFVSMGLDKVGLMYGNEVILKDASFSVSTGERVGLVGPNGCGKVSISMVFIVLFV
jgi:ABC-type multidrug transport system fused ATPase/permease subunit